MKALAKRDPYKLGLAAIGAGVVLALVVVALSVVSFGTTSYTAVLQHTAGLRSGEDVEVAGVSVGEVRSVELAGDTVRVTFTLDKDIHLGSRSTAAVKVATLLGTHYLQVAPKGAGDLAGSTIPMARTTVPYNLQDVLQQGTSRLEELDSVKLAQALTAMSQTLKSSDGDFGPALSGVARLSQVVATRTDQAGALLTAARSVTDQLSGGSNDLVSLMKQTNLVVSEVTRRRDAIHKLFVEATTLLRNLTALVDQTREDVHPALQNINTVLATLRTQDQVLRKVVEEMAPTVRYLANAAGNGPWVDLFTKGGVFPPDDLKPKG